MIKRVFLLVVMSMLLVSGVSMAQDDDSLYADAEPVEVELTTEDELTLIGDYWAQLPEMTPESGAPAVLLLHMLGGNRGAWEPMVVPLLDAGFAVLAVDMRGHGATRGSQDWTLAESDHQLWLDWLREQEGVRADSVSIIGASIGSNMALIGCANDADCVTAVALSPGLDYRGVQPAVAVTEGLAERSALLIGARGDGTVVSDMLAMADDASGEIGLRIYRGRAHGTNMFSINDYDVIPVVIDWLIEHLPE